MRFSFFSSLALASILATDKEILVQAIELLDNKDKQYNALLQVSAEANSEEAKWLAQASMDEIDGLLAEI